MALHCFQVVYATGRLRGPWALLFVYKIYQTGRTRCTYEVEMYPFLLFIIRKFSEPTSLRGVPKRECLVTSARLSPIFHFHLLSQMQATFDGEVSHMWLLQLSVFKQWNH